MNDASALHAADVGISVESAVDVAKEAADIVLMQKDLNVLVEGVKEGRSTFANTLKYVFMATSANFGNMFSMAGISLVLPFLPLLPSQILITNLLTDFPEMTIATDRKANSDSIILQFAGDDRGFCLSLFAQGNINLACKFILRIPKALSMTDQNQFSHYLLISVCDFVDKELLPRNK